MKIKYLKKFIPRTGIIISMLFFGIATQEAIRSKNWIAVGYWGLIAFMFLLLDRDKDTTKYNQVDHKES